MLDFIQLRNDVKKWVRDVTGLDSSHVINQNSKGTTPTGQYATVRILDPIRIGSDTKTYSDAANDTVDINYEGLVKIMVSVNIYRENGNITPLSQMALLKASFNRISTQDYFRSKNIGIIDSSESRDLSSVFNDAWTERRQMDAFFYLVDKDIENVTTILKVSGDAFGQPYDVDSTL